MPPLAFGREEAFRRVCCEQLSQNESNPRNFEQSAPLRTPCEHTEHSNRHEGLITDPDKRAQLLKVKPGEDAVVVPAVLFERHAGKVTGA